MKDEELRRYIGSGRIFFFTTETIEKTKSWLIGRETDIALDIEDLGDLRPLFIEFLGREPKEKSKCEQCQDGAFVPLYRPVRLNADIKLSKFCPECGRKL